MPPPYKGFKFEYPGSPEIARLAISHLAPEGEWTSPYGACLELYEYKHLPDGKPNPGHGEWILRLKSTDPQDRNLCATMTAYQSWKPRFSEEEPQTSLMFSDGRDGTWSLEEREFMEGILGDFYRAVHREVHRIIGQRAAQAEAPATTGNGDVLAELPKGFPRKPETIAWHKQVYQLCVELQAKYRVLYEDGEIDDPKPRLCDYRDFVIKRTEKSLTERRIHSILEWGNTGLYDHFS